MRDTHPALAGQSTAPCGCVVFAVHLAAFDDAAAVIECPRCGGVWLDEYLSPEAAEVQYARQCASASRAVAVPYTTLPPGQRLDDGWLRCGCGFARSVEVAAGDSVALVAVCESCGASWPLGLS